MKLKEQFYKVKRLWCELRKRDGLIAVKWISSTIYQFNCVKILLILFLLIHIPSQIFQLYVFVCELNLQQFTQYAPAFFILFYGTLAALLLLTDPELVENLHNEIKILSIDCAKETTKLKIEKEMLIVTLFYVVNTIGLIFASIILYICTSYDYQTFLPIKHVTDNWPEYLSICRSIYKASICIAAPFIFLAHCYQVIYYTQHIKYQFWMLIDQINQIKVLEERNNFWRNLIDRPEYQKQIKTLLINVIERHVEIIIPGYQKIRDISNYIIYFSYLGLLCLVSVAFVLYKTRDLQYDYRYVPLMCLIDLATFAGIMTTGQSIETVTENARDAFAELNWYNMNMENRTIYLILLTYAQKDAKIKLSENYSLNNALGLATVRGAYSVVSVLAALSKA